MTYASTSTIVAFRDTKEAALYSNHVVPIKIVDLVPIQSSGDLETFKILAKLLPSSLVDLQAPRSVHPGVISYVAQFLMTYPQALGLRELRSGESIEERNRKQLPALHRKIAALLSSVSETVTALHGVDQAASSDTKTEDVSCQLIGLNLVDVSQASWRQILDFREDENSARALRNLRLFLQEKFDGKSREFVRDSLLLAIEKHDEAVRRWGFETKSAVLESIFSSKSLAALAAGTLSIAFGAPIVLGAAAVVAFEIGNVSLKVVGKRRGLSEFRQYDPVTYLVSARELSSA